MIMDLYQLDTSTLVWTSFPDARPPPGRAFGSLAAAEDTGALLLFGGVVLGTSDQNYFNGP